MKKGNTLVEIFTLVLIAACFLIIKNVDTEGQARWTVLGFSFILLGGFFAGRLVLRCGLPAMTGYVFAGLVGGPFVTNLLTQESIDGLRIFDDMALAIIAFIAGGEIVAKDMARDWKLLLRIGFFVVLVGLLVLPLLGYVVTLHPMFSHLAGSSLVLFLAFFTILVLAKSPAATVAIIQETGIKNRLARVVLIVVVLVDVVTIVLFAMAQGLGKALVQGAGDQSMGILLAKVVGWEIFGSLFAGLILGVILAQVFKFAGIQGEVLSLLVASYFIVLVEHQFHLHYLLVCLAAGFFVQNYTESGQPFIHRLEDISLPLYLLLFTLTAANLNVVVALKVFPLALFVSVFNWALIWALVKLSCRGLDLPKTISRNIWLGLISMAGVSFGLVSLVEKSFPQLAPEGSSSNPFTILIISVITINLILGPLMFKFALRRSTQKA